MPPATLQPWPAPAVLQTLQLPVGDGHLLQVQTFGSPAGIPALVLHGGPGSGCSPVLHQGLDPARYFIVCPDQRGAGASQPRGATHHNTLADLLADLHWLRAHLRLPPWLVVGGSWGAALALAHAAAEPDAVRGLLLRSSLSARPQDLRQFMAGAPFVPACASAAPWAWMNSVFQGGDAAEQALLALAFGAWEQGKSDAAPRPPAQGAALAAQIDRCRVMCHYLAQGCWLQAPDLLARCRSVPQVPTLFLHADDDRICPPDGARQLWAALPQAGWQWVVGAGHDPAHPDMARATRQACEHFAEHGDFEPL